MRSGVEVRLRTGLSGDMKLFVRDSRASDKTSSGISSTGSKFSGGGAGGAG